MLLMTSSSEPDPLKPLDNNQFLGQLAQFSTVQGIDGMRRRWAPWPASWNRTRPCARRRWSATRWCRWRRAAGGSAGLQPGHGSRPAGPVTMDVVAPTARVRRMTIRPRAPAPPRSNGTAAPTPAAQRAPTLRAVTGASDPRPRAPSCCPSPARGWKRLDRARRAVPQPRRHAACRCRRSTASADRATAVVRSRAHHEFPDFAERHERRRPTSTSSNNVANASSTGFKARAASSTCSRPRPTACRPAPSAPACCGAWPGSSGGNVDYTGRSLDMALTGEGFFTLSGSAGITTPAPAISARPRGLRGQPDRPAPAVFLPTPAAGPTPAAWATCAWPGDAPPRATSSVSLGLNLPGNATRRKAPFSADDPTAQPPR